MSNTRIHGTGDEVAPLLHWPAASGGAVIATGISILGGLLWTAAAFSSHDSWSYNHLAWWIGATLIVASLVGGLISGIVSRARGGAAGAVTGATTGAIVAVAAGTLALLALAVNGSTNEVLTIGHRVVTVDFVRPYIAFWTAAGTLAAAAVGGTVGGLLPRSYRGYPTVKLATVREIELDSSAGAAVAGPQHAAAS